MYYHQTWYGIYHNFPIYLYVIYQQTSITVQYKINLKYLFINILYPTLCSLQNQTLDGCIMYLTGSLVSVFHLTRLGIETVIFELRENANVH